MTWRTAILLLSAAMVAAGCFGLGALCERQRYADSAELIDLCGSTVQAQARALKSCTDLLCDLASGTMLERDAAIYCEAHHG